LPRKWVYDFECGRIGIPPYKIRGFVGRISLCAERIVYGGIGIPLYKIRGFVGRISLCAERIVYGGIGIPPYGNEKFWI
jgi:hypothetical protein